MLWKNILYRWRRFRGKYPKTDEVPSVNEAEPFSLGEKRKLSNNLWCTEQPRLVWKSTRSGITKLIIPKGTLVRVGWNSSTQKCRAEAAYVLEVPGIGKKDLSLWDSDFYYVEGEFVEPEGSFDTGRRECSDGIHFFMTKEEAKRFR